MLMVADEAVPLLHLFQNRSKRLEKVHVVIGPQACDLDSLISTFTYAYFLDKVRAKQGAHSRFELLDRLLEEHFLEKETYISCSGLLLLRRKCNNPFINNFY